MSRSRTAAALFLLDPARPGAVLVSLALGEEAHNASVRGAAQAALAGLAGGEGEEKGQQTGLDSLLPTDAEAALHAFVEEGQGEKQRGCERAVTGRPVGWQLGCVQCDCRNAFKRSQGRLPERWIPAAKAEVKRGGPGRAALCLTTN